MNWRHTLNIMAVAILTAPGARGAAEAYVLQPGDTISVRVIGAPEIADPISITLRPDGTLSFPRAGTIDATGLTVPELTDVVTTALGKFYQTAEVSINLTQSRNRMAYVAGAVVRPGPVTISGESVSLTEAIGATGGVVSDAGVVQAVLHRSGEVLTETVKLDDNRLAAEPVQLRPGDVVTIEGRTVTILGEVASQGPRVLPYGARITTLVSLAGRLSENADAHRAMLLRSDGSTVVVDLPFLIASPDSPANIPVDGVHTMVIPPKRELVVVGAVVNPGPFSADSTDRLVDAIAAAGGPTQEANLQDVTIINATNGQAATVDLAEALHHPGGEADPPVVDASAIVVGRRRNEVVILGEVVKPTRVPTDRPLPLSVVLAAAAGFTDAGDPSRVELNHEDGNSEIVDASGAAGRGPATGIVGGGGIGVDALPGDTIIVHRRQTRVIVLGMVRTPGTYLFESGDSVVEAVSLAGGFSPKAYLAGTSVLRRDGDVVQVMSVNMRAALKQGSQVLISEPLQDQDIVYVPGKKRSTKWRDISASLLGVASIVRIFTN